MGCTCFDLALAVSGNACLGIACGQILFRDGIGAACGQAHNLGSLVVFQFEVFATLDGFGFISAGNGILVLGIGGHVSARQLKLHRKYGVSFRVQTLGGFHLLGNFQAAGGVHGQLTVVAKVQHTLICVKIPLEVNAALRGAGSVTGSTIFLFLIAQLVINGGGQAAFFDALLDVALAIFCFNALFDFVLSCNANGHIVGLGNRLSTITGIKLQVVQLIVIGLFRLYHCGRRISAFTGIQQGILGVIVEAVACCGGKGGRGQADGCFAVCRCFVFIKFVGVEADFAVFGVIRNVGGKVGVVKVAGRNLLAHTLFKADRVDDADGLGVVDFQRRLAIGVCDLIIPQGQHTGRNLDLHTVAVTAAAMGDGDNDVAQIGCMGVGAADRVCMLTLKGIGIHRVGGFCVHLRKDLVGKGNGLKALDYHIIAQGIIESHVAVCFGLVCNMRGACQCDRYGIEDVLKDLAQLISAGSRHIVICFVGFVAEVPVPVTTPPLIYMRVSGKGVVAGDRLHKLVFIRRAVNVGARVSTVENTNGVDLGTCILALEGFSRCDGRGSYRRLKIGLRGRCTIGKEDDNLFGIAARRFQRFLGLQQAIVRLCGTGRSNTTDRSFERSGTGVITYGKPLYDLRVVVCAPPYVAVGIIADSVRCFAGKFHDGQFDFLIFIRDFLVLSFGVVNKGIDSAFQRGHARCATAHSLIHTAGGIQHHDNIQSLCIGGGGRRIGGQRRQRDQEISVFGHCDRALARQVDFVFLHRFVGPNTACGGVVISLRIRPRVHRVGVADGLATVGSCLCHGGFPLCIGRDRDQHREQQRQRQQGGLQPYKFTMHSFYSILSLCCGDIYK